MKYGEIHCAWSKRGCCTVVYEIVGVELVDILEQNMHSRSLVYQVDNGGDLLGRLSSNSSNF